MTAARLERGFWGAALLTKVGAGIAIYGRVSVSTGANGSSVGLHGGEVLLVLSITCWTVYSILARLLGLVGEPNLHPNDEAMINLLLTAVFASVLAVVAWNNGSGNPPN